MLATIDAAAKRARFDDLTAGAQLDYYHRIQNARPLTEWEMLDVQRLLDVRQRRRARLAAANRDRPAHRRAAAPTGAA